jgi:phosphopantothenoylcysteine decarboxylase/phosphopantothenate--cysteine ligase
MSAERHILLGVTGSIAAYKSADLVRRLMEVGCQVSVMMTQSATKYVGPLTFQALSGRPVNYGRFEDLSEGMYPHIDLGQGVDLLLIAPCTANVIAKIAHGIADDVLTATVLARSVPLWIAPAMNDRMWENPATQDNLALLRKRDIHVLDVGTGELACGSVGAGRMMEPNAIVEALCAFLDKG